MKLLGTTAALLLVVSIGTSCKSDHDPAPTKSVATETRQAITEDGLRTALAAYSVKNASVLSPTLACAGQIDAAAMDGLGRAGIDTFISLRLPDENGSGWEEAHARSLGMNFVRIPIAGAADISYSNAKQLRNKIWEADGPVLVYCGSSNRVGTLLGLGAYKIDGKTAEEAIELGKRAGMTRMEPVLRERMAK